MLVLSDLEAARDLLGRRSSIYSDRPRFVLFSELCVDHCTIYPTVDNPTEWVGTLPRLTFASTFHSTHVSPICSRPYSGPLFRKHRRFIQQSFNQRAITAFRQLQNQETLLLLDGLIQTPESFVQHFRRSSFLPNFVVPFIYLLYQICRSYYFDDNVRP